MPLLRLCLSAEGHGAYDWHGDYVSIAVKSGNVAVLNVLLEGGYELKWQQAQVGSKHACGSIFIMPDCPLLLMLPLSWQRSAVLQLPTEHMQPQPYLLESSYVHAKTRSCSWLQDLIKAAAEQGSAEVMGILLSQPLFKKDEDELDEAVDTGTGC